MGGRRRGGQVGGVCVVECGGAGPAAHTCAASAWNSSSSCIADRAFWMLSSRRAARACPTRADTSSAGGGGGGVGGDNPAKKQASKHARKHAPHNSNKASALRALGEARHTGGRGTAHPRRGGSLAAPPATPLVAAPASAPPCAAGRPACMYAWWVGCRVAGHVHMGVDKRARAPLLPTHAHTQTLRRTWLSARNASPAGWVPPPPPPPSCFCPCCCWWWWEGGNRGEGSRSPGVRPWASGRLGSAPAASSSSTQRCSPPSAALCRGVARSGLPLSARAGAWARERAVCVCV